MKQKAAVIFAAAAACAVCLAGCTGERQAAETAETVFVLENPAAGGPETETAESANAAEASEAAENANAAEAPEAAGDENVAADVPETGMRVWDAEEPVLVTNPGWEYYFDGDAEKTGLQAITLHMASEKANQITDEEAWFAGNGLTKPGFPYEDDTYRYETDGENGFDVYLLKLYDKKTGKLAASLDFSNYRYADDFAEADADFVEQRICYAEARDGVLYVATAHNTYSASSSHTAYVTAIDLADFHVLWKSEPLMSNASSFAIIDDAIVCGYGFTAEEDFLNIIDIRTGKLWEQIPIKSKADYIIRKDDVLYVRTYNTDYTFYIVAED